MNIFHEYLSPSEKSDVVSFRLVELVFISDFNEVQRKGL
jgi:hypothetical protein